MKKLLSIAATAVLLIGLCSCTAKANLTVTPASLASNVSASLVQNGVKPDIDCGKNSIDLVVGNVVHCDLTVSGDPTVLDVTVKITEVDGTNYQFTADVANK